MNPTLLSTIHRRNHSRIFSSQSSFLIAAGDRSDIREDENGDSRNWGASGNEKLHGWEFDRFARLLEYKAEEHGILVDRVDEENTSKTCSCCGQIRDRNRVERGLYVRSSCETIMNADVNGAVNIRRKITQSPPTGDMSNGWLAQPGVFLFDRGSGRFSPREQGDCKPYYPNTCDARVEETDGLVRTPASFDFWGHLQAQEDVKTLLPCGRPGLRELLIIFETYERYEHG